VVELGFWVAGPAAAGILADWGAEVVKIEPRDGDPFRGLSLRFGDPEGGNPPFELDNRGKRSVVFDLAHEEGRAAAYRLLEGADAFVSNLRPAVLERLGLGNDLLRERFPRLVIGSVTGYGLAGPERDRPAYDVGAFWARSGVAASLTPDGQDPPVQRGGMGDHTAGLAMAGAICAALLARQRTGEGQVVATSLMRTGGFMLGWDHNITVRFDRPVVVSSRTTSPNPIMNAYTAGDGRRFWLINLQADRHWPDVARTLGHPEWIDDPRFATIEARAGNAELIGLLDEIFATRPLDEWGPILDAGDVWWAPLQTIHEVLDDPQAHAAGLWVDVPWDDGERTVRMVATPVDFAGTPWQVRRGVPEVGQHTEEVLLELGYDWDDVAALKEKGAIP
jgi:crotonobetainyl-CoA:carnitine CoA-transferase CaiB-like acyl-CoA transferase